jgi:vancomycin permeability regulator SanA
VGGPAATYMPTGAVGRHGPSEASVMAALLEGWGVPQGHLVLEETGRDTLSSVRACARLLRGRTEPVRVATSGYHLPRCLVLLRLAGVHARACPAPAPASRWRHRWYWRLREGLALPVDVVLSMFG